MMETRSWLMGALRHRSIHGNPYSTSRFNQWGFILLDCSVKLQAFAFATALPDEGEMRLGG